MIDWKHSESIYNNNGIYKFKKIKITSLDYSNMR